MDRPRREALAPLAVMAIVVAIIGTCVAVVGHHKSKPVTNSDLLRLVHSASSAFDRTPSDRFAMTMAISQGKHNETIQLSGLSSARSHESSLTMTGPGIAETAVSIGGVEYIKLPYLNAFLNNGKDWLAVRSPKPTAIERQLAASGPAGLLNGLATVKGTVENEGADDVRGVETTKYRFHLNALKLFGSTFAAILGRNSNAILKREGFESLPMTLWLDKQGLPREVEIDIDFDGVSLREVGYMTPSNSPLNLAAPPTSDVHTVGSLQDFGRLLRQTSS